MPPTTFSARTALLAAAILLAAPFACARAAPAQSFRAAHLVVTAPWSRATPPGAAVAVLYLAIRNLGSTPDRLLSVATPIAGEAMVHETLDIGGVMEMRAVGAVDIAPGKTVRLRPSGLHVMLTGLKRPLRAGMRFPATLKFAHAGTLTVIVRVRAAQP